MSLPDSLTPTDRDREVFHAVQGSERVCAKCLNLVKEERDEPSERWRRDRDIALGNPTLTDDGKTSSDAIVGFQPPDERRTSEASEGWYCGYCGATDPHTPYESGYSPGKDEMVDILWNFVGSVRALGSDPAYEGPALPAIDVLGTHLWAKRIKSERSLTNAPIYDLVPALLRLSRDAWRVRPTRRDALKRAWRAGLIPTTRLLTRRNSM